MKKKIINLFISIILVLLILCGLFYSFQESLIFFPQKLKTDYKFNFSQKFEERYFEMTDGSKLHSLLFKSDSNNGLVFYLHGNAGSLAGWGNVAIPFVNLGYDVLIPDYRGYGKSEGTITSEKELIDDIKTIYSKLLNEYEKNSIVIVGYSLGTGLAANIASKNNPKLLILKAPYYNFEELRKQYYPFVPPFLLKYKFETNKYISSVKCRTILFHGDIDSLIPLKHSKLLKKLVINNSELIILKNQSHNGISNNEMYKSELMNILSN